MQSFKGKQSFTRDLVKQTWSSQSAEFFLLYGQRLFGLITFVVLTYLPLHYARVYSKELNWLYQEHYGWFIVSYLIIKDAIGYGYTFLIMFIYWLNHPFFEQYKINTDPWPWQSDPKGYEKQKWITLKRFCINMTLSQGSTIVGGFVTGLLKCSFDFEDLPSYPKLLLQFAFCFVFAEFYFYWSHRIAHLPQFYWIHKKHHEARNTVVMDAQYVSFWEFYLIDFPSIAGGLLILGPNAHFITFFVFGQWQLFSNLDDHAGYEFPWMFTKSLPWCASNTWHNYHHLYNIGNYSAHTILWDCIFGTCKSYADHFDVMENKKADKGKITQICAHTV